MYTIFISDLHLSAGRPKKTQVFNAFIASHIQSKTLDALYILGDFFNLWLGDDSADRHDRDIIQTLATLTQAGVPVFFMRGNRDFLIDQQFAQDSGCTLLPDPSVIDLYGKKALLMHGDSLCVLDVGYQRFRRFVQAPMVRRFFLALPVSLRQTIAQRIKARTHRSLQAKNSISSTSSTACSAVPTLPDRFDVTQDAVEKAMHDHQTQLLIHGHTHTPGIHSFTLNGQPYQRIVLGEWSDTLGSVLIYSKDVCELKTYTVPAI